MRIEFITESFSAGMGYTENMLPRYLAKRGHEVRVFCSNLQVYGNQPEYKDVYEPYLGPAEQLCGELNEDGFVVERLQHFMLGHYIGIRGFKEALLRFRLDVIQATSVVSVATLEALMASLLPSSLATENGKMEWHDLLVWLAVRSPEERTNRRWLCCACRQARSSDET